ncbi:MAG: cytochrome c peroxidase [Rhodobacteraceae bacterium HLUCCA08]|nr:MAG: cytochrome c peroxidase [Rhodobacteraceae bacterium HLUCCA08]
MRLALPLLLLASPVAADIPRPDPVTDADYAPVRIDEAELGRLLFYDPILSGNREVACASCHHPEFGTGDGLSLGLGDGGTGLGPAREMSADNPPEQRIPRNAPALFNLGALEFSHLFHDGRVEVDAGRTGGYRTPMGPEMEAGFASALSAQTMFPVLSADEMAGHYGENDVSRAVRTGIITGPGGAWDILARRVAEVPDYAARFEAVYGLAPDEIRFTHVSDAIAVFMEFEWRSDEAPFDAWLRGEAPLPPQAQAGAALFYGAAGCAACHSGPFLTDHGFHAMGDVQLGPGKAERFETHARDEGRFRVTGDPEDLFAFRTPSLRNVAATAPYGHAGAFRDLAAYLRHHADPVAGLAQYDRAQAVLPPGAFDDWRIMDDPAEVAAIATAVKIAPVDLSDADIAALVAFLDTLSDPVALEGRLGVPETVPSGLPVPMP